jgi:AraC-like DNA-binding protein
MPSPTHNWIAAHPTGRVFHSSIATPLGRITWAGRHLDSQSTKPMAMRRWDTYSAVYVLKGRARFHDETGLDLPVRAGDLMLMFPRHGYRYLSAPGEPWSEFFIQFRGPIFGLWMKEGLLDPRHPIHHIEPVDHWLQRLETIIKPLALPEPAQSLKRVCLLQEFLLDAVIAPQTAAAPADSQWLAAAQDALSASLSQPITWESFARRFDLSYHRFRKKFTALGGVPPAAYRIGKVIEHAETLLHNRRLSLRDIARQCGFYDEFHFAKRFKALTGLTPAQYRKRV